MIRVSRQAGWASLLVLAWGVCLSCAPSPSADERVAAAVLARNAEIEGRFDWARIGWAEVLETADEEDLRQTARVRFASAWLAGYQRSLSAAAEGFEAAVEADPDDRASRERLVGLLTTLGDGEAARAHAEHLGDGASAQRLRAEAWLASDLERARRSIEHAIALDPSQAASFALGARIADRAGDDTAALEWAQRAIALDPLDARSWYLVARQQRARGSSAAARRSFEIHERLTQLLGEGTLAPPTPAEALEQIESLRALGLDPGDAGDSGDLSTLDRLETRLRLERGEPVDGAVERLAAVVDRAEQGELARLAVRAGRLALARRLYERLLSEEASGENGAAAPAAFVGSVPADPVPADPVPADPGALSSLVILDLDAGDLESASARLEVALEADPEVGRYHLLAGRLAVAQDRPNDAAESFHQALRRAPWHGAWRRELADLYRVQGDLEAFRAVLAAAPSATGEAVDEGMDEYLQRHRALLESPGSD